MRSCVSACHVAWLRMRACRDMQKHLCRLLAASVSGEVCSSFRRRVAGSGHTCSFSYSFSWFSWLARLPLGRSGRFRMLGLWLTIDICGNRSRRRASCVPVEAKGPTVSCPAVNTTLKEGRNLVLSPKERAGQRRLACLAR